MAFNSESAPFGFCTDDLSSRESGILTSPAITELELIRVSNSSEAPLMTLRVPGFGVGADVIVMAS